MHRGDHMSWKHQLFILSLFMHTLSLVCQIINRFSNSTHFKVRVALHEEENICSLAFNRGKYLQEVNIEPQTTRSVPFIIIPMKEGEYHIEVKAAVEDSWLSDGIIKMLQVVVRKTLF